MHRLQDVVGEGAAGLVGSACAEGGGHVCDVEAFGVTVNFTRNKPDGSCVTVFKVDE